jgi:hypothetical protein
MPRNPKSAVVAIRMAPQLREALRQSAQAAGCSLNSFAVQVLAAAAGHGARFRGTAESGPTDEERALELREIERDGRGFPHDWKQRSEHRAARSAFWWATQSELGAPEANRLVAQHDAEDPGYFVEWVEMRRRRSDPAA